MTGLGEHVVLAIGKVEKRSIIQQKVAAIDDEPEASADNGRRCYADFQREHCRLADEDLKRILGLVGQCVTCDW
ncbi:hypothetical protein E6O75_ATG11543 [Venturia nashicola]|uniref:Uncharacterized protein n=1 Tax=Venturia nashicola TaxID=86259 RepID=A0A4Z1P611_9PEZI|nr:hypothetical protein E6O75_ATG11543 [Venturia nashicola]